MKLGLFLVVLLGVALCLVNGHCVRKDDSVAGMAAELLPTNSSLGMDGHSSEESGVKKFFKNLGCDIADAGRQVKESVKKGYNYVKTKLSTDKDKEVDAVVQPIPNPERDQKVFDIDVRSGMNSE